MVPTRNPGTQELHDPDLPSAVISSEGLLQCDDHPGAGLAVLPGRPVLHMVTHGGCMSPDPVIRKMGTLFRQILK